MKTVSFCSLGCRVNQYEIQSLREQFIQNGYAVVPFGKECDVAVINTCAVTKESEKKSRHTISYASKYASKVVVTGCFAELCRKNGDMPEHVWYLGGCSMRDRLFDISEGRFTDYAEKTAYEPLSIGNTGSLPNERFRAYVKIEDGCNGRCAYCIIPSLRGRSYARNESDIIEEIKRLSAVGVSEIILTGIEVSDYGSSALCSLIKKTSEIDGIKRIRLGSLNPNTVKDEFIECIKSTPSFCRHLHLSVQSGCTPVLNAMKRPYNADKLKSVIASLYKEIPDIMLTADVISGFPGETEENFEETLEFIKQSRFMHVHAFPYSVRPGTVAAEMDHQIPECIKKERNLKIIEESEKIKKEIASSLTGTQVEILVEKNVSSVAYGHTDGFMEAKIENSSAKSGSYVVCTVTGFDGALICREEK